VREHAVSALSEIADPAADDALRAALNSKDADVRRNAVEALGDRRQ
jgi:HEAT repeat protein